jgi:hypothetical protein
MTAEEKLWQLVQRLAEKTAQGAVVWEATAAQNTYQTSFPQYSVRIVELDNQDDYRRPQYMLEMLDGNGSVIERVDDADIQKAVPQYIEVTETMRNLYRGARRSALSVDSALDSLLLELEKAS